MKLRPATLQQSAGSPAFALKDLVVIVAVILLLAAVQLPLWGRGDSTGKSEQCRNNLRQLILAWQMYSTDNHGEVVGNHGHDPETYAPTWAWGVLDYSSRFDNVNLDYLINSQKTGQYGLLGPYVKTADSFRCPADTSQVSIFGRLLNRVRTVAMNNWMGGTNPNGQTGFRVFTRQSDIVGLPPSQAWVIQDQREDNINDSVFTVDMVDTLAEYPGSYHSGGGFLSYADGHVDYRQWEDPRTNPELIKGVPLPSNVSTPANPDLEWLRARTTVAE